MTRFGIALLAVAISAQLACVSRMASELRAELVGIEADSLRACMGSPSDVDQQEAGEVWVYRRPYPHRPEDISLDASSSAITPNVPNVSAGGEVDRSTTKSSSYRPEPETIPPGACFLFFSVERGTVGSLEAAGRSWEGVHADDECALLARACRP